MSALMDLEQVCTDGINAPDRYDCFKNHDKVHAMHVLPLSFSVRLHAAHMQRRALSCCVPFPCHQAAHNVSLRRAWHRWPLRAKRYGRLRFAPSHPPPLPLT